MPDMNPSTIMARVVGGTPPSSLFPDGDTQPLRMSGRGDLRIAQSLPPYSELVRHGGSFAARIPLASAFTTVAAYPTTLSELLIFNGEPIGGKSYLIDQVSFGCQTTQAAATVVTIVGQIVPNLAYAVVVVADNSAVLRTSLSGRHNNHNTNARLVMANTSYTVTNRWIDLAAVTSGGATATVGLGGVANVEGRIIVPPGAAFGCNIVVGTAAASSAVMGLVWHEVQLERGQ